ncbi:hypothetical protein HGRIS_010350 [Hohenbuehelia grisea]|uniref:NADAR domain-containing protein n=1 Tax=Hohenbuehelia grisea TaxID=104357 RepID=A0ABR3J425_9AGAR
MGVTTSKKQNPYPFPVPQYAPPPPPQFYPNNPYAQWGMQPFPTDSGRESRKSKKRKGPKSDEMAAAMGMGWGQGYAPFPNPAMYPPFAGAQPMMPGYAGSQAGMAQMYPQGAGFQRPPSPNRRDPASHVRQMPPQSSNAPVIPPTMNPPQQPQPVIPDIPTRVPSQGNPPPPLMFTPNDAPLTSFPNGPDNQRRTHTPHPRSVAAADGSAVGNNNSQPVIPPPPILNSAPAGAGDTLHRSHTQDGHSREPNPNPALTQLLGPQSPVAPGVFGPPPTDRPSAPIRNPLPPPPRDLYETTPYKGLLDLPHTTALLSAAYGSTIRGAVPTGNSTAVVPPDLSRGHHRSNTTTTSTHGSHADRKKKGKGFGLFRSLTGSGHRRHESAPEPENIPGPSVNVAPFIPVFLPSAASTERGPAGVPASSSSVHAAAAPAAPPLAQGHVAMLDESQPPVRFSQSSPLAGFLNHSNHRVLHQNRTYPSATHLFEAMKYLGGEGVHGPAKQEAAERIRGCKNVAEVYPLSAEFQSKGLVRPDWGVIFNTCMDEVLYLKFKQHPDLRTALMGTGMAPIIYEDAADEYWGEGPHGVNGANELGKALVRVRARLRAEGYGM